uniref:Uncharacterized protein n=1 Tax=Arundo donax TaxID=35708 RepID=A0A0A9DPL5_ARUDO
MMQSPLTDCIQCTTSLTHTYLLSTPILPLMSWFASDHNLSAFRPFISASVCLGFPTEIRMYPFSSFLS